MAAGFAVLGIASCSVQPKGALMLAVSTDMQTPKDISVVSIFVSANSQPKFDYLGRVLPDGTVALPATLAVVQPDDPSAKIRVRVIGFEEQDARVLRDVITTVPQGRTALLRLPLNMLDLDSAKGTLPTADLPSKLMAKSQSARPPGLVPLGGGGSLVGGGLTDWNPLDIQSSCPVDQTSINGTCTTATIDSSTLPTYDVTSVYGDAGLQRNHTPVACFDVAQCFRGATPVANVDTSSPICSFAVPAGASIQNVALVTGTTGACIAPGECFVPLVNDPNQGWAIANGAVKLVSGVCKQLRAGAQIFVATSGCGPLEESLPVCEPTTPAGADAGAADSGTSDGAPDGALPDATADGPSSQDATGDASAADATIDGPSCVPATCKALGYTCGYAGDGCGALLQCGTCEAGTLCGTSSPYVCGPGSCPLCAQVATCDGSPTTISGLVLSAAAANPDPVPNVLVYVPNGTPPTFTSGVSCASCTAASSAVVSTYSVSDGSFSLQNVPSGSNVPVVIQLGRWRRQFTVNVTACTTNPINFNLPASSTQGDIPLTAISTGTGDLPECTLRKMGIADTEFTTNAGGGRFHLYSAAADNNGTSGSGAVAAAGAAVGESTLMGSLTTLDAYDQVLLPCWSLQSTKTSAELANLTSFVNAGGKVYASHYSYQWLQPNPSLTGVATWDLSADLGAQATTMGTIESANGPHVSAFFSWMTTYGYTTVTTPTLSVQATVHHVVDSVPSPSVSWIDGQDPNDAAPPNQEILFTFDTPYGGGTTCGRVAFAAFHTDTTTSTITPSTTIFPAECANVSTAMSVQNRIFEYSFWDLAGSTCTPPTAGSTCTPRSCQAQGLGCGPAGDGCGGLLDCGTCATGLTCGAGGPSTCGVPGLDQ
jgi:hypothetical protein